MVTYLAERNGIIKVECNLVKSPSRPRKWGYNGSSAVRRGASAPAVAATGHKTAGARCACSLPDYAVKCRVLLREPEKALDGGQDTGGGVAFSGGGVGL